MEIVQKTMSREAASGTWQILNYDELAGIIAKYYVQVMLLLFCL